MVRRFFAALCLGAFIAGCAADERSQYVRDGVAYGVTEGVFRGRWWSYYERGASFLAGKFYDEAIADFEQALRGRNRDSWRARTYGLHFVEYFPNRELGIALFHQGRLDEAEQYLNASLAQIDTERALFYIDEIKRARIAAGQVQDAAAPVLRAAIVTAKELPAPVSPTAPAAPPAPAPEPEPAPAPQVASKPVPKSEPVAAPEPKPERKPEPVAAPEPKPEPVQVAEAAPASKPAVEEAPQSEPAPAPESAAAADAAPAQAPAAPEAAPAVEEAPVVETAREAAMKEAMAQAETLPPAAPAVVADNAVAMNIDASDDNGVSCVFVDGEQLYQRGSVEEKEFKKEIVLEEGTHTLEVAGMDLANKAVKQEVEVTVDTTGPTIGVFSPIEPTVTDFGTVVLEGASVDKVGVSNVNVDATVLAESEGAPRLPFDTELPLGDGENTFILASRDVAGNETRSAIKVFKGDPDSVQAKLWLIKEKYPERLQFALADPGAITPEFLGMILAQADAEKQQIRLKSPSLARPYNHSRSVLVSGDVVTQSGVTSILIDGVPFTDITGAPKESFSRRIPIRPGEMQNGRGSKTIRIEATDKQGNQLREEFTVDLATAGLNDQQQRLPVAVLGFQGIGVTETVPSSLQYQLADTLAGGNRFRVLSRDEIVAALQQGGITADPGNPDQAVAVGAALPAQLYLTGSAIAQEQGIEIKARVINRESGEVVDILDAYVENVSNPAALREACWKIAAQFEERYPRASGEVTGVRDGGRLTLNLGEADGLRPGAYVLLLRREPDVVDPDSGEVIWPGAEQVIGRARIERVGAEESEAVIVELQEGGAPVEEGMPAVTM